MEKQTRRKFLVNTSIKAAGLFLLNTGFLLKNVCYGSAPMTESLKSSSDSELNRKIKILIVYGSYHGSTAEIAKYIGKELFMKNTLIDVRLVNQTESVGDYDIVIIGSPVHYGKWIDEITEFVRSNYEKLNEIPVACFLTCLAVTKTNEESRKEAKGYLDSSLSEIPEIKPFYTGIFAGKLDYKKCTFFGKIVMKLVMNSKGVEEGDYRDWGKISSWASNLQTMLTKIDRLTLKRILSHEERRIF